MKRLDILCTALWLLLIVFVVTTAHKAFVLNARIDELEKQIQMRLEARR